MHRLVLIALLAACRSPAPVKSNIPFTQDTLRWCAPVDAAYEGQPETGAWCSPKKEFCEAVRKLIVTWGRGKGVRGVAPACVLTSVQTASN